MSASEQINEQRRAAALESLAVADPDQAQTRFTEFFGAGSGAWNAWDESFVEFIEKHRSAPLLSGTAGRDLYFLFSPSARAGFWVVAQPGGTHGKGFLTATDVAKLIALAREKGLVAPPA
jgi:hypothetical protein